MCATYELQISFEELEQELNSKFFVASGLEEKKVRVVPFYQAPVLLLNSKNELELELMQYSLIPTWSKERKPKFATYNARIETVLEKPTWKESFQKFHCVVPLTKFIEPIYKGDFAGHMVGFESSKTLLAAGLYNRWVDRNSGEEIASFAMLMRSPIEFVAKVGHDRSPIFLDSDNAIDWLQPETRPALQWREHLLNAALSPSLTAASDRPMAKGWEKRAAE